MPRAGPTPCPDAERIACFIDCPPAGRELVQMLEHFDRCDLCLMVVVDALELVAEIDSS